MPVARCARAAARKERSSVVEMKSRSDATSPMIPALMPVSPTPSRISRMWPSAMVPMSWRSNQSRSMYGMAVVARAHDDLEPGPLRDRAQLQRVAPDLDARAVDECRAARVDVVVQLRHRELDVVEHAVAAELLPEVEEDVLVGQRRAQLRRGHRALDGHDRAGLDVGGWGSHPIPPPSRSLSDARSASHSGPASERAAWIKT